MGWVVAFAGQKGGAGKTTAATGFAVSAAQHGATVSIGDMDFRQRTSTSWGARRKERGYKPTIDVQVMANEKAIKLARELVDLLVLDLPGRADDLTLAVAKESDLVVVVTDTNVFELEPTVSLLRALEKAGISAPKVVVALTKVLDEKHGKEATTYLEKAGFKPLPTPLMHYMSVHDIGNDGRSAAEIANASVGGKTKLFFQGLMSALTKATEHLRDDGPERSRGPERGGRGR